MIRVLIEKIRVRKICVEATSGAEISECVSEAINIAIGSFPPSTVLLTHNDKVYTVDGKAIVERIIENPTSS